jgi:nucleotide-binding universal stress UspA family protein
VSEKLQDIVVGIASIDPIDPVLGPALRLASEMGATLHAVHAFEPSPQILEAYAARGHDRVGILTEYARLAEGVIARQAEERDPEATVQVVVHQGPPDEVVSAAAERVEAGMIVVGSTHRGRVGRTVLGTTAERIIRAAGRPVLMIRRGKEVRLARVLLATDLSAAAGNTADRAIALLRRMSEARLPEMRMIHTAWHGATLPPPVRGDFIRETMEGDMATFISERGVDDASIDGRVRIGTAADTIAREARDWDADLVVVGTHRRRGIGRMLGSVAAGVLRDAPCHALVVPVAHREAEGSQPGDVLEGAATH